MNPAVLKALLQWSCPLGASLDAPGVATCLEDIGEIVAFALQRTRNGVPFNQIVLATTNPELKATGTGLVGAVDSTKVVFLEDIANAEFGGGEPREAGTGQGGVPNIKGTTPTTFTAQFQQIEQDVIRSYRPFQCVTAFSVFLINDAGQIIGLKDATTAVNMRGIPIKNFYIGPKIIGQLGSVDYNNVSWSFLGDWSDYLYVVTPTDFDPVLDF